MLRAADIHAQIGAAWPAVLVRLGIPEESLRLKRAGPCPACGGRDRFTFDNRKLRGDFICRGCGAGDGFGLLMRVHGWGFPEARRRVLQAAVIETHENSPAADAERIPSRRIECREERVAEPTRRVCTLARSACAVADCPDAVEYLESRGLWPLPAECGLRAHPSVEYFAEGRRIGKFPALLAEVRDRAGALVTVHVTYLRDGRKLEGDEPRKILSPLTGRDGCAVRLMLPTDVLGIAEGIETALSAALLEQVPVWAALNTALLAKFEPPEGVRTLRIFADRDEAGLTAAAQLAVRLQGRVRVELQLPTAPAKDFNDALTSRSRGYGENHA